MVKVYSYYYYLKLLPLLSMQVICCDWTVCVCVCVRQLCAATFLRANFIIDLVRSNLLCCHYLNNLVFESAVTVCACVYVCSQRS